MVKIENEEPVSDTQVMADLDQTICFGLIAHFDNTGLELESEQSELLPALTDEDKKIINEEIKIKGREKDLVESVPVVCNRFGLSLEEARNVLYSIQGAGKVE